MPPPSIKDNPAVVQSVREAIARGEHWRYICEAHRIKKETYYRIRRTIEKALAAAAR